MSVYGPRTSAGSGVSVYGTTCASGSNATAVLVKLLAPGGALVASAAAVVQGSSSSTSWNVFLTVPATAVPSPFYEVTASCRSNGKQLFAYAPVALSVGASRGQNLAVAPDAAAPGSTVTVSGTGCVPNPSVPSSVEAVLVDPDGQYQDADAARPSTSGAWTTTLQVPAGAPPGGVWDVAATCDTYYTQAATYLEHAISVQSPAGAASTTLTWTGATSAPAGAVVAVSARLTSAGAPVAGLPVTLALGSASSTVRTEANGEATALVKAPIGSTTTATATFSGGAGQTSGFASAATSTPFGLTAGLSATTLALKAPASVPAGEPLTLTATLTGPGATPVAGRPVTFLVAQSSTYYSMAMAALTNTSGVATMKLPGYDQSVGQETFQAVFPAVGDSAYGPASSKVVTTQVTPAITPVGVACTTTSSCAVVDSYGRARYSTDGAMTWSNSTVPAGVTAFDEVACTTGTACVAIAGDANGDSAHDDALLGSADAGKTWTTSVTGTGAHWSDVTCASSTACVAVGAGVDTSSDGGVTWTAGTMPANVRFTAVSCATATACVAVSLNGGYNAVTYTSSDGGSTWSSTGGAPFSPLGAHRLACSAATVCSAADFQLYTTSNGSSWSATSFVADGGPASCASSICVIVTGYGGMPLHSTDGGSTWAVGSGYVGGSFDSVSNPSLDCIPALCIAAGGSYPTAVVSRSTDGGVTWSTGSGI